MVGAHGVHGRHVRSRVVEEANHEDARVLNLHQPMAGGIVKALGYRHKVVQHLHVLQVNRI